MIEDNDIFKNILKDFENKHPGKGKDLKSFIVAQAAFKIFENVSRKLFENTKEVKLYNKLESEIVALNKMIKLYEAKTDKNLSKEEKKALIELKSEKAKTEKAKADATTAYAAQGRKLNDALMQGRIIAKEYKIPEENQLHARRSKKIN